MKLFMMTKSILRPLLLLWAGQCSETLRSTREMAFVRIPMKPAAATYFFSFAHLIPKQFGFCSGLSKLLFDGFSWTSLPSLRAFADTKMESPRKTKPTLLLLLALQINGNDATQQKWSMPFGKIRSIRDNSRYWLMVLLSSRRSHFKRIVVIKRHSFCLQMTLFQ